MRFEFATASRIIFGPGTVSEAAALSAAMGKRACVVTGRTTERAEPLLEQLGAHGVECVTFNVAAEPTTTLAREAVEFARRSRCDLVLSIGGGSALDTGKVVAAMLTNTGEMEYYLEVIGAGKPLLGLGAAYRDSNHRRHGRRGHAQRRAERPRVQGQGQYAQPADAAPAGDCRS